MERESNQPEATLGLSGNSYLMGIKGFRYLLLRSILIKIKMIQCDKNKNSFRGITPKSDRNNLRLLFLFLLHKIRTIEV